MQQFDFGKNWLAFSRHKLSNTHIETARNYFISLFDGIPLFGKSFLDIGFGQGIPLLIAAEQGALVTGCDINIKCVEALVISAEAFGVASPSSIVIGSILEEYTLEQLREHSRNGFDVVHSWGVLHHTGNMQKAIEIACGLTAPGGHLVLAIYNRHWSSPFWRVIKRLYCSSPSTIQKIVIIPFYPLIFIAKLFVTGKNPFRQQRGMDFFYNIIDWIGGYPYEYATAEELVAMVEPYSFECIRVVPTEVPTGCNQFIFRKI